MAITEINYTSFSDGDERSSIRTKLNALGNSVETLSTEIDTEIESKLVNYVNKDGSDEQVKIKLTPQATEPTHFESTVFYDDNKKALTVQTDIPDFNHNLGQETVIRVINRTGATIPNGSIVVGGGADATTLLPTIRLGQADTFANAQIMGVTTHDIATDSQGFVTNFGLVNGVDTSGLTAGMPAYLSDTVAGGLTSTQPDIISRVGGIVVADAIAGKILVNIQNSLNLPNILGFLQEQTLGNDTYSVTTTSQPLLNYDVEGNIVMDTDPLLGTIKAPQGGIYEATFTMQATYSSSPSTRTLYFELYDGTSNKYVYPYNISKDATSSASSFTIPFSATAGQVMSMNIRSSIAIDVTFDAISFSIKSLDIR